MPPVFGHGRLRLYLLKLLGEAPRHGYEVIRLLEERFQGLYAPSAGTVYPRLAKLEAEGLVTHSEEGGRKVYSLTPDGERELAARDTELTDLEREIRDSLAALAADIREDVSGSAQDLRQEVREAAAAARSPSRGRGHGGHHGPEHGAGDRGDDRAAWKAEARRAREESRRARREAREAREAGERAAQNASEEARAMFTQAARRIQERVQTRAASGDWPGAVREGLEGLNHEIGGWSRFVGPSTPWAWGHPVRDVEPDGESEEAVADPERELIRLLDRFRDDVRDAARDHGVSQDQLRHARRHLSASAAHLVALLRLPEDGS
ncbi:PadR family transcriptional regulator [Streptomyces sp. 8K308]|uniref:PadR family transcriptional regulator n=1 Tax=Streptomyces sp. 8K308 TaxID=2530388 RepID=UPI001050741E|nr:PadR family transcriptional regulator [Streptomyces sp. 8K308]TDC25766.1 PadR family transcriptional regulator [Streptomyces sp. 8K308]